MMDQPEVTIKGADNGYIVEHYERSAKKDEPGRTVRRVAETEDDAVRHAKAALGRQTKKKSTRGDGQSGTPAEAGAQTTAPAAHSLDSHSRSRNSARRRRPRAGGRR